MKVSQGLREIFPDGVFPQACPSQTLRTLEADGLLLRDARPVVPPHVEYSLTPLGGALAERVVPLMQWFATHADEIAGARS